MDIDKCAIHDRHWHHTQQRLDTIHARLNSTSPSSLSPLPLSLSHSPWRNHKRYKHHHLKHARRNQHKRTTKMKHTRHNTSAATTRKSFELHPINHDQMTPKDAQFDPFGDWAGLDSTRLDSTGLDWTGQDWTGQD